MALYCTEASSIPGNQKLRLHERCCRSFLGTSLAYHSIAVQAQSEQAEQKQA
jgi:hypothetical protein